MPNELDETSQTEAEQTEAPTAERARVAAIIAAALVAHALPALAGARGRRAVEPGDSTPAWVAANRARTIQAWQPPRQREEG
jgi:hypothetical protein